nr:uncharacterized protein LOC128697661 isoform X2 [Cherax quadricarinatus]
MDLPNFDLFAEIDNISMYVDAGSPTHPSSPDVDYPPASPSSSSALGPECSSSASPFSQSVPEVEGGSVVVISPSPASSSAPVRIIVKTRTQSVSKMVAPITIQKPSHNLVKIPKIESTLPPVVHMRTVCSGGKLGPSVTLSKTPVFLPPATSHQSAAQVQVSSSASSGADAATHTEQKPFKSLHREFSEVSDSSQPLSCGAKRKAYELEPQDDPKMERCRLNAINAKRNREMKKARMADLERKVEDVSRERDQLAGENESLKETKLKLEEQVKHLSNIIKNQSKLSSFIRKLGPSSVLLGDMLASGNEDEVITSGMCLHVDGDEATIEYCSHYTKKAGKKKICNQKKCFSPFFFL